MPHRTRGRWAVAAVLAVVLAGTFLALPHPAVAAADQDADSGAVVTRGHENPRKITGTDRRSGAPGMARESDIDRAICRSVELMRRLGALPATAQTTEPGAGGQVNGPVIGRGTVLSPGDCVGLALAGNVDIRLALFPALELAEDVAAARAVFDPALNASVDYDDRKAKSSSRLQGASVYKETDATVAVGLARKNTRGTTYGLSWNMARRKTNSSFFFLNPSYTSELKFEARRSLTKLRTRDLNLAELRMTERNAAAARCDLHAAVNETMLAVFLACLKIKEADENLSIQEQSLQQVKELVEITRKRMAVGRAVEAQLIKDQAQMARQKEDLIVARSQRQAACDRLLELLFPDPDLRPEPEELKVAIEMPGRLVCPASLSEVSRRARRLRPEVLGMLCRMNAQDLAVALAADARKPDLDLVASVALQGVDGDFPGSGSSMATLDYPEYRIGLQYSVPLGLRASRSRYRKAMLQRRELDLRLMKLESGIELEVRNAMRDLVTSMERVKAAKKTLDFADRSYRNEKILYRQGRTTAYQVNEYRLDLADARLRLVQAKLGYLAALATLRKAEGTLPDIFARRGELSPEALAAGIE